MKNQYCCWKAAQKFLLESPILYNATNFVILEREFKNAFAYLCDDNNITDLNNLYLLPQETIKCFGHRLNVLVTKVYKIITDKDLHENIKYVTLMKCLPSDIRVKLKEENIRCYEQAVKRTQICRISFKIKNSTIKI